MKKTIISAFIATLALAACGESTESVEYYKTHDKERGVAVAKCSWNPSLANCDAAEEADAIIHPEKYPFYKKNH